MVLWCIKVQRLEEYLPSDLSLRFEEHLHKVHSCMKLEKGSNARVSTCLPGASRQCQFILTSISRKTVVFLAGWALAGWASVGSCCFRCGQSWFSLVRRKDCILSQSFLSSQRLMTAAVIRKLSTGGTRGRRAIGTAGKGAIGISQIRVGFSLVTGLLFKLGTVA